MCRMHAVLSVTTNIKLFLVTYYITLQLTEPASVQCSSIRQDLQLNDSTGLSEPGFQQDNFVMKLGKLNPLLHVYTSSYVCLQIIFYMTPPGGIHLQPALVSAREQ